MRVWDSSQISGNLYVSVACKFLDILYFSVGAPSLDPRRRLSLFRSVIDTIITLFHWKKYYIVLVAFYTPHIGVLILHRYYLSNNLLKWLSVASAKSFLFPGSATVKPRPLFLLHTTIKSLYQTTRNYKRKQIEAYNIIMRA